MRFFMLFAAAIVADAITHAAGVGSIMETIEPSSENFLIGIFMAAIAMDIIDFVRGK